VQCLDHRRRRTAFIHPDAQAIYHGDARYIGHCDTLCGDFLAIVATIHSSADRDDGIVREIFHKFQIRLTQEHDGHLTRKIFYLNGGVGVPRISCDPALNVGNQSRNGHLVSIVNGFHCVYFNDCGSGMLGEFEFESAEWMIRYVQSQHFPLKGKKIACQQGGPHVGLLYDSLGAANLKKRDVTIFWTKDITGENGPAEAFRKDETIDACCVITPDMMGLST
jgi:hypothetical protein